MASTVTTPHLHEQSHNTMASMFTPYLSYSSQTGMGQNMAASYPNNHQHTIQPSKTSIIPKLTLTSPPFNTIQPLADRAPRDILYSSGEEYMGVVRPSRKKKPTVTFRQDVRKQLNLGDDNLSDDETVQKHKPTVKQTTGRQDQDGSSDDEGPQTRLRKPRCRSRQVGKDEKATPRSSRSPSQHRRPALKNTPKLFYDGNDDWDIFADKYQDYTQQMNWTQNDCKACLKWCLRGKASK